MVLLTEYRRAEEGVDVMADWPGVKGKTVLVTGATSGIGLAAAEELSARGARLGIVARDKKKAAAATERIRDRGGQGTEVEVFLADLSSLAAVRGLAGQVLRRYPRLDALVNNAGAVNMKRQVTVDGFELTWAVNHLAPFLLTTLLLDRLRASAPARVVTTASHAHRIASRIPFDDINAERSFKGFTRYGESKLANILFTVELARRLEGSGVTATCFHPGFVASGFNRNNVPLMRFAMNLSRLAARSPRKGAETLVWLLDSADVAGENGGYYMDCRPTAPSEAARDQAAARRLWELSEEQTASGGQIAVGM
jgi:NAD(P)-dependent dehydrogenase (short-subunit alcohol dehydrogenase family)